MPPGDAARHYGEAKRRRKVWEIASSLRGWAGWLLGLLADGKAERSAGRSSCTIDLHSLTN